MLLFGLRNATETDGHLVARRMPLFPMNPSFIGDEGVHCATRWPTVSAALRRPNGSAVGALRMRYFRGEWLSPGKLHHNIGEREGEMAQVLLGRSGSQEGAKQVL